jgi:crotonobetaine/carnitine-CoA ligase
MPRGETGELCFRAREPGLHFLGYFRNDTATAECMRDGWFRSGDLARMDAEDDLFFLGRVKDSVRRRGINISAWEVERVILDHPDVEECALVGVPSEIGEDELKIFIRAAAGATIDPRALHEWCRPRMPKFQLPRYIALVQDFPRTPTQRIMKRELPKTVAESWDSESG